MWKKRAIALNQVAPSTLAVRTTNGLYPHRKDHPGDHGRRSETKNRAVKPSPAAQAQPARHAHRATLHPPDQRGRFSVPRPAVMNSARASPSTSAVCQTPGGLMA